MTDSNINNLLDNNKKEENTNEQLLETTLNNEQPSKTDLEFNKEVIVLRNVGTFFIAFNGRSARKAFSAPNRKP